MCQSQLQPPYLLHNIIRWILRVVGTFGRYLEWGNLKGILLNKKIPTKIRRGKKRKKPIWFFYNR